MTLRESADVCFVSRKARKGAKCAKSVQLIEGSRNCYLTLRALRETSSIHIATLSFLLLLKLFHPLCPLFITATDTDGTL